MLEKKDPESSSIINDVFDNNSQSSDFLHGIIEKLYPKITEKTNNLKNQVEIALRETNTVDNVRFPSHFIQTETYYQPV